MKGKIKSAAKPHYIVSVLAVGGIAFAAMNFSNPPLFNNTDNFVLFAQEAIELEKGVQVSSGDLGSNGKIDIEKGAIINGNLFADRITVDKNSTINGNVSFNKLKAEKDAQILGTQTKPVQLPIANLPDVPDFQFGTQDFKFTGETNTLTAGSYRDITLEKNSKLVLPGGLYNLRKLELKDGAILIFSAPTTLNIQFKLRGHDQVSVLPGSNIKPDDLKINYLGIKPKKEKEEKEDDDDEINSESDDDKERKDHKERKMGRPVIFGKNSFLNFKLLAPKANVHIEKESTIRGQILARKIKIEKDSILSREEVFNKEPDPEKIVTDTFGDQLIVNEIVIVLVGGTTLSDAQQIASIINGKITAVVSSINLYKIEVSAASIQELNNLIAIVRNLNDPRVELVTTNNLLDLR